MILKFIGTAISVWNWEAGKNKPNAEGVEKLVCARQLGKREARAILAEKGVVAKGRK